jgi:H+/Cl- antiporter ClcA
MSASGWGLLIMALLSTISFLTGAFSGEMILFSRAGSASALAFHDSPGWFLAAMAFNFVFSCVVWVLYFSWLKERRHKDTVLNKP